MGRCLDTALMALMSVQWDQVKHNVPFTNLETESQPKSSWEPLGYTVCMQHSGDVVRDNNHDELDSSLVIQD